MRFSLHIYFWINWEKEQTSEPYCFITLINWKSGVLEHQKCDATSLRSEVHAGW